MPPNYLQGDGYSGNSDNKSNANDKAYKIDD